MLWAVSGDHFFSFTEFEGAVLSRFLISLASNLILIVRDIKQQKSQCRKMEERMETVPLMLNLMRMSRETICGNKLLVHKLSNTIPTGIIEIRASTIRWILNVGQLLSQSYEFLLIP